MNSQLANLVLVFFTVQLSRKFDLEDPDTLLYIRLGYTLVQALVLGILYYVSILICNKNDATPLKYVEPPKPFTDESPKPINTTFLDYDMEKVNELYKQTLIGVGLMMFIHFYFNFTQPLIIQSVLPVKNLISSPIVQIHVFGKPAEGDLKRPFKNVGPFGAWADSQQPQTDKAAIKKAEKQANKKATKKD